MVLTLDDSPSWAMLSFLLPCIWLSYKAFSPKRLQFPHPPSPPGHVLLGHLLQLPDVRKGYHIDVKLLEWAKQLGRTYFTIRLPFLVGKMIIVADPLLVQHICVKRNLFKSFTYKDLVPIMGSRSMLMMEGSEWLAKRKAFAPGFSPDFLKQVVHVLAEKLERLEQLIAQDVDQQQVTHALSRFQTFTVRSLTFRC